MEVGNYYRDTWIEVDLDCIYENVVAMKRYLPKKVEIIAVVKANAYGHGDIEVAKTALEAGASYLAVAFLDEALSLRQRGITAPILVLGATRPKDASIASQHNITLTITHLDWLKEAKEKLSSDSSLTIHVKLDTGMGRLGVKEKQELLDIIELINKTYAFLFEGVFTHFATADELDTTYFYSQYKTFIEMLEWLPEKPKMIHCGNSATGLQFPEKVFNAVRMGIAMYGLTPSKEIKPALPFELKEAFTFHSKLVQVKQLQKGEKVSYGATYTAEKDIWVGTVPVGYADGWIRKMQNFHVIIDGHLCQIIGRVCMDQFMVLLPKLLPRGSKVTLIGKQNNTTITIDDVAEYLQTINYEIPCTISSRVPRIFLKNKSIIEVRNSVLMNH